MRLAAIPLLFVLLAPPLLPFSWAAVTDLPEETAQTDETFLLNLAGSGMVVARVLLGKHYLDLREYGEALKWLRLAAAQRDVEAQQLLALMYEAGLGVEQDNEQAAAWYRRAAEQGDSLSLFKTGFPYTTNAGIP